MSFSIRNLLPAYRRAKELEALTQLLPADEAEIFKGCANDTLISNALARYWKWKFLVMIKEDRKAIENLRQSKFTIPIKCRD